MTDKQGSTPTEVLGRNVYALRSLRRLSQGELAVRMRALGHRWHQQTVSELERRGGPGRSVTIDEFIGLAISMGVAPEQLLDPAGVAGDATAVLWLGGGQWLSPPRLRQWLAGKITVEASPIEGTDHVGLELDAGPHGSMDDVMEHFEGEGRR